MQGNPVGVFAHFACRRPGGLQHFFVEGPFLEAKLFGASFPVQGLLLKQLIQRAAAGVGAVVVEGGGAGSPVVAGGEPAQAVNGTAEGGGGPGESSRGWKFESASEKLVISGGFVGLAMPEGRGVHPPSSDFGATSS